MIFLDGQEKSNFQNCSNKFCISLEDVKNCRNQHLLKFLTFDFTCKKKAHKKAFFLQIKSEQKIRPFLDGQEKSYFLNFSTKFCISFEDILNYLNIIFHEINLEIWNFPAHKTKPPPSMALTILQ